MNNNPSEMGSLLGSGDNVHLPAISIEDESGAGIRRLEEINEDIQMSPDPRREPNIRWDLLHLNRRKFYYKDYNKI